MAKWINKLNSQQISGAVAQRCSLKKVFLIIKKEILRRCFPLNFSKFLRSLFYRTRPVAASEIRDVSFLESFAYIPNEWTLVAMFKDNKKTQKQFVECLPD